MQVWKPHQALDLFYERHDDDGDVDKQSFVAVGATEGESCWWDGEEISQDTQVDLHTNFFRVHMGAGLRNVALSTMNVNISKS